MQRLSAFLILIGLLTTSAHAAAPVLGSASPRGFERGKTITLRLNGSGLGLNGPEIRTSLPASLGPIKVESPDAISLPITFAADAPIGYYPVQVRTADGLTSSLLMAVGDLPETNEVEPNDEPAQAQPINIPIVVQGTCGGTDRDHFRFETKKGDRVEVEIEARRLGSGLDPALTILDSTGKAISSDAEATHLGNDLRLTFIAPADGPYLVVVNDIKFAGAGDTFYRLKVGKLGGPEALFPLGWQRGKPVELTWLGGALAAPAKTTFTPPSDPDLAYVLIPAPAPGGSPHKLILGDQPEVIEADGIAVKDWAPGTVMNGRISAVGEVDQYRLAVTPGQTLQFAVGAGRFGSRLDTVLTLTKVDGSTLIEANGFDTSLDFQIPADVPELIVKVRDLIGRGGPGFAYRLRAQPVTPEFQIRITAPTVTIPRGASAVLPVQVTRGNVADAIQLSIPVGIGGVTAVGGLIPAGATDGTIVLTASADAPIQAMNLEIWGQAGPPTQPIRKRAVLVSDGTPIGPLKPSILPASVANGPAIVVAVGSPSLSFVHGSNTKLSIKITRPADNKEPVTIAVTGLPPQITGGTATIAGDKSEGELDFATAEVAPVVALKELLVTAKFKANGRDDSVTLPPVTGRVVRPFTLELLTPVMNVTPGTKTSLTILVRRVDSFSAPVKVTIEGTLPPGVIILPIIVPAGSALAQLDVTIAPGAAPAGLDLLVRGATEMPGRKSTKDYQIPDLPLRVNITPAPASPAPPVAAR